MPLLAGSYSLGSNEITNRSPGRIGHNRLLLYAIDDEIHHRGQGYVYLRSLGIEPPPFYERE